MTEPMAPPPPPPPPPPPAPASSSGIKWLIGCGLGCLVIVIVIVLVTVGGFWYAFDKYGPELVRQPYQQLKQDGKVPSEHEALYERLVEAGSAENASLMGRTVAMQVIVSTLQDGQVTEEELSAVEEAVSLLEANPDLNTTQAGDFFEKYPQLQSGMQGFPQPATDDAVEPPSEEPAVEEPAPAPETPAAEQPSTMEPGTVVSEPLPAEPAAPAPEAPAAPQ